jgi:hypothetical protein
MGEIPSLGGVAHPAKESIQAINAAAGNKEVYCRKSSLIGFKFVISLKYKQNVLMMKFHCRVYPKLDYATSLFNKRWERKTCEPSALNGAIGHLRCLAMRTQTRCRGIRRTKFTLSCTGYKYKTDS